MRRFHEQLLDPVVVDNFAGGGGASIGIEWGLDGRPVDLAVNHDPLAVEMHQANHPFTEHLCEDVFKVDPRKATGGRRPLLAWFSPDCTHFSRAKGAKPVKKKIRGLAWVAVRWARTNAPDVMMIENVREFQDWGPLVPALDHRGRQTASMVPDPARKGVTFRRFIGTLRGLGYAVEWQVLNAADYGAPTHRRRLFIIARRDGKPIVWPKPTHGPTRKPWRTAAECIDWTIPCPSIFDRKRPLAEKTQRRIALGIKRYVLDNPRPFIVRTQHGRDEFRGQSIEQPLGTVTAKHGYGVVAPTLVQTGYSERPARVKCKACGWNAEGARDTCECPACGAPWGLTTSGGQTPRALDLGKPLGTVVAGGAKHAVVSAFLSQFFGGRVGKPMNDPVPTVTACDHNAVVSAALVGVGGRAGQSPPCGVDEPVGTVTAKADRAIATAFLTKFYSGQGVRGRHAPASAQAASVEAPLGTVTAQSGRFGLVYSFLTKYFGTAVGQELDAPMHTVTGRDRFGVVTVEVEGITYAIADIGLRMLTPRELARAQGFPEDYILPAVKSRAVKFIGNSVAPPVVEALVRANVGRAGVGKKSKRARLTPSQKAVRA